MTATSALVFNNVTRTYVSGDTAVTALNEVCIDVKARTICGLIGPDGAGKTSLMRLAAGLLQPDSGSMDASGIDVVNAPLMMQSVIGYMPQRFGLYEDLTVQENLDLYADLQGLGKQQRSERYAELMQMTALSPFVKRLAGHLSGGMKQKLGLACALVGTPRLLLLDEPTVGVDPVSRRELWAIVDRLVHREGVTVLLSTAYLDEAERCDKLVLLHEGQVTVPAASRRRMLRDLRSVPGIVDTVIDNDQVRIVTREPRMPDIGAVLADGVEVQIEATAPAFEDAFVATLRREHKPVKPGFAVHSVAEGTSATVIEVNHVQKRFGDFIAVRDVSFSVSRGEVFGLLGANGAGKSTTFRMLCGLLPASSGELKVAGHDLRRAAAKARSRLGYMAQRFSLYVDLTVSQNLNFFASAYGLGRVRRKQRIDWALDAFELGEYADSKSGDLPLGYKQRLAMAAALLHEPDILFLDEPTSGVDPLARREFWQQINALAEAGVTVLVTTHFMEEANYCDRLVIMADGQVLAEGTPLELKSRFRTEALPSPTMEDAFLGLIKGRDVRQEART